MTIIYVVVLIAAIAVAAWAGWQLAKKNAAAQREILNTKIETLNTQVAGKDDEIGRLCGEIEKASDEVEQTRNAISKAMTDNAAATTELELTKKSLASAEERITTYQNERETIIGRRDALDKEVELLRRKVEEQKQLFDESQKRFDEIVLSTEERLKNATAELLKVRSAELEQNNSKAMDGIVKPLQNQLRDLQSFIQQSRDKSESNTATVSQWIKNLMERTAEIGDEATRLTNALTYKPQVQGNWGETILGNILESAGLLKGRDYEEQPTMRDSAGNALRNEETNRRMRPDVILHFPDKRDAIIDSKVSLTAFSSYVSAETEAEKALHLRQHMESLRSHVDELAKKKYNEYVSKPHTTIDFVIMFVPSEGAFQVAMQNDATLWSEAFARGVCIAGELNLTVMLRMISMAWVQFNQTQNQEKVFKEADLIVKRVGMLCKKMETLGNTVKSLKNNYDDCNESLHGNKSITVPALRLVKLGAKDDKRIHQEDDEQLLSVDAPSDDDTPDTA